MVASRQTLIRRQVMRHGALWLIFVVGAVLRFANLGLIPHSYDASYPIADALRILDGHVLPLVGQPSSVFLDNPPLMSYLQVLPLLVWRSPWAVYLFIIGLNTLATILVYNITRDLLGKVAAFFAALLVAVNPWLIYYSRLSWVQGLMPFLMALIAWGLWPTLVNKESKPERLMIAAIGLALMLQTYIQAWGALIPIGLLLLLFRRNLPRRPFLLGCAICLIATIPYGIGLIQNWDVNSAKLAAFTSGGTLHFTREGIDHALRFVTGMDFEYQTLVVDTTNWRVAILSPVAMVLLSLAIAIGITRALHNILRRGERAALAMILLVWFCVPVLMTSISTQHVHAHYLLISLPAGYVLAAWGIEVLWRRSYLRWPVVIGSTLIALVFTMNLFASEASLAQHPTGPKFDGWSLEAGVQVGDTLRALNTSTDVPSRMVADGRDSQLSSWSGQYLQNLNGLDYPNFVVVPSDQPLLYVLSNAPAQPADLGPRWQLYPDRDLRFADGTRVSFRQALTLTRQEALALPASKVDWPSESGLSLLGYTINSPASAGHTLDMTTYWRVDQLNTEHEGWYVGAYYQLAQSDGGPIANIGQHSQWARRWALGDTYIEHVQIPIPSDLPSGSYQLIIGLSDSIHKRNFALLSSGSPQGTFEVAVTITNNSN